MDNAQNTALLVMDMQPAMTSRLPNAATPIANAAKAIAHARKISMPVIYVRLGFRQGTPEISTRNKTFAAYKQRMGNANMDEFMQVAPEVAPLPGDIIVTKRRISGFTGSDLDVVLRAQGITHIVLSGFSTSGVVLSTFTEAIDKDYQVSVLPECCADANEELHRVLTTVLFPLRGSIITLDEWCS